MLRPFLRSALACALLLAPGAAAARERSVFRAGALLFEGAFDPERSFAGEVQPYSMNEMLLTAAASARDDYAPAWSLAIAHLCEPVEDGCRRRYEARMLRVAADEEQRFDRIFALLARVQVARSEADMRAALDASKLQWLEANLMKCEGALAAFHSVRLADWRPDVHHFLDENAALVLHPAMLRVAMWGSVTTTRYEGWVLSPGVPAAVAQLVATLEPCWSPSRKPRPWQRPQPRRRPSDLRR